MTELSSLTAPGDELGPAVIKAVIPAVGRSPRVFEVLRETKPGRGGEIQPTDALQELAQRPDEPGGGMYGVVFRGRRYDTGDRLDHLKAVVRLGSGRGGLGPDLPAGARARPPAASEP